MHEKPTVEEREVRWRRVGLTYSRVEQEEGRGEGGS